MKNFVRARSSKFELAFILLHIGLISLLTITSFYQFGLFPHSFSYFCFNLYYNLHLIGCWCPRFSSVTIEIYKRLLVTIISTLCFSISPLWWMRVWQNHIIYSFIYVHLLRHANHQVGANPGLSFWGQYIYIRLNSCKHYYILFLFPSLCIVG